MTLKPDGKLTSLCWSTGVAMVNSGSVPLIALKVTHGGRDPPIFARKGYIDVFGVCTDGQSISPVGTRSMLGAWLLRILI